MSEFGDTLTSIRLSLSLTSFCSAKAHAILPTVTRMASMNRNFRTLFWHHAFLIRAVAVDVAWFGVVTARFGVDDDSSAKGSRLSEETQE